MTKLKFAMLLVFGLLATAVMGQVKISGTVTDNKGISLPGVNVIVKDLNQGGATDLDGKFSFSIPTEAKVLVFSFMGYTTQEVVINGQTEFHIVLQEETVGLDEAIVVAYGTTKRASFTGSASVVKGDKITEVPVTSFEKALSGQVSGVQVANVTGQPGSASEIRIRGMGSINASNSPLYVIDGVPVATGNMNNENSSSYASGNVMAAMNPSDIASITVLKDAAAASLYGSRAANGVILITTKRGQAGKTSFNFKAYHGVSDFAVDNYTPASGPDYLTLVNEGLVNRYGDDEAKIKKYRDRYNWYVPENGYTDWVDLMFDTGKTTSYEFSAKGGNEKTTFYASGSYFDQDGMAVSSALERITGRVNLTHKVNDYVSLGVNILQAGTEQTYVPGGSYYSNPFYNTHVSAWPIESPYDENGELVDRIHNDYYNVYREKDLSTKTAHMNRNMTNGWVELKPFDFLTFKSTNALDWINHDEVQWSSPKSRSGIKENGNLGNINQKKSIFTSSNILTADKVFLESHHVNLLAGFEIEDYNYKRMSAYGKGLPNESLKELNVAAEPDGVYGYTSDRVMVSYLSRLNYDFKNRYYFSASFRRDGSSKLGTDERWANFYSLSGSWRVSEEAFMQSVSQIDNLKLRLSYGTNGTLPTGNYDHLALYSYSGSYNSTPAAVESQIANPALTWEKNENLSLALEFRAFNRISGSFEYFNRHTYDLLLDVPISMVVGNQTPEMPDNIGEMRNRGWEVELRTENIIQENFRWNTTFYVSSVENEVLKLNNGEDIISGRYLHREGLPYYTFYLPAWAGVNPDDGTPQWYVADEEGNVTDEITGDIGDAGYANMGAANPDIFGSISNQLTYKNFSLSFSFNYSIGGQIYCYYLNKIWNDGKYDYKYSIQEDQMDRWQKPGDNAKHPQRIYGGNNKSYYHSSRYLFDNDYLRLKNLSLSYTLPNEWAKRIKLEKFRIYASGTNLLTFAGQDMVDPEQRQSGYVKMDIPNTKVYTVGVEIQF